MEIHALTISFTQDEIGRFAAEALPTDIPISEVAVRLSDEGAHVHGVYKLVLGIPFETQWELAVRDGKLAAHLAGVKVIGLGAGMISRFLMKAIADASASVEGLEVEQDTIVLDLDLLLASRGFPSRTNLIMVQCREGQLLIEAQGTHTNSTTLT